MSDHQVRPSRLQEWLERLTAGIRHLGPRGTGSRGVIPVQVDLVGDTGVRSRLTGTGPAASALPPQPNPFLRQPAAGSEEATPSSPMVAEAALSTSWSFRETVVLRPTHRTSRVLLYGAVGFTGATLLWLVIAPLNQTVAVQGKLEPDSKVKTVQTPVPGIVDEVLVKEGQSVAAGQLLLRFDLRDATSRLRAAELVRNKLLDENRIFAVALGDPEAVAGLSPNQRLQLRNQAVDLTSRREAALQELRRSEARQQGNRVALATAMNIERRYEELTSTGAVSEVQRLESKAKVDDLRSRIAEESREQARLQAQLRSSTAAPNAEYRGRIETNLRQIADQDRLIREARLQLQVGELRAPASGTVFDLEARRGTVAQAAQPLLKVVPQEALRARVYVPSSAIGFIHVGQKADLSLDTFPAMDYGRIEATVVRVGSDALTPEEQQQTLGTQTSGLFFPAVLRLSRQSLQAGNKQIPLQPGMGLTADIQLRQRRMIQVVTGFFEDKRRSLERLR